MIMHSRVSTQNTGKCFNQDKYLPRKSVVIANKFQKYFQAKLCCGLNTQISKRGAKLHIPVYTVVAEMLSSGEPAPHPTFHGKAAIGTPTTEAPQG